MDPNLQVAFVGVLATLVTTVGVVAVAVLNNRRGTQAAASAGVEAGLDDKDVLDRIIHLVSENERKERRIIELQNEVRELRAKLPKEGLDPSE